MHIFLIRSLLLVLVMSAPSLAFYRHRRSTSTELSTATLDLVEARLAETANDTWVSGTRAEALLELHYPSLSVFSANYTSALEDPAKVRQLVDSWSMKRNSKFKVLAHVPGGAAGDPPALGVPFIVVSQQTSEDEWRTKSKLWNEATAQLDYLLEEVPRTRDGAISHRPPNEEVQLWSDSVYMVPPFIAYFGVLSSNSTLIKEAYNQCKLYRQYLKAKDSNALQHVVLGGWQDKGIWATGNAWAAAGMTRVIATLQHSAYSTKFPKEIRDLKHWTNEILVASFSTIQPDGLLLNYYDDSTSFTDSAGSALLAATAYRLALLDPGTDYSSLLESASNIRLAVNARVDRTTGWLNGAVDPLSWKQRTDKSPEAQAFVLLLHSAWRDYEASKLRD
ncbi:uncharacterized protein JCM6883_001732 [Sporobolomyces salmoneus]|uniref:uncharacterized protein n=1 Tax=Sporobolomyces salmoneus TaxID=183962 RepID=UPI00317E196F